MDITTFPEFIAAGATTEAGFAIDTGSLVYNTDPTGALVSVRGTVKAVDPKVLGQGIIASAIGAKLPAADMVVVWDTNGKPKNASPVLALCAITKPAAV